MAIMMNCATDWTFDLFADAMDSVQALPMAHGVRPSRSLSDAQVLATYVKTAFKFADFSDYVRVDSTIREILLDMNFSDWYKDVFNQRPHFDYALIGALCGVHGSHYTSMMFCADPMGSAKHSAKLVREQLEQAFD